MRTIGPTSGQHHFFVLSVLSILTFCMAANLAWGFSGKGRGNSAGQLSISSAGPSSGPVAGGTTVTLSGSGFATSASVSFGGIAASSVVVVSSTQLRAVTPAHASGTVSVTVTESPHNQSATLAGGFTYTSTSSSTLGVSGASPTTGPTCGGTVVTITGNGFQAGAAVKFGSSQSTAVTVASSTQINAMSPPGSSGTVSLTVTDPNTQSASLPSGFTYSSAPAVSSISPNSGPVTGGTTVKILGSGFQSGASVAFGGIPATSVTLVSSTEIQAVSPVSPAGTVAIAVANTDLQSATLAAAFTYFHTVTLSWTDNSSGVSGFNVYRSPTSGGPYARLNSTLLSGTSFSDNQVQAGQTYFYVTTAVNSSNAESGYSNQAQTTVPSP
jgi:IPT/TIG domain